MAQPADASRLYRPAPHILCSAASRAFHARRADMLGTYAFRAGVARFGAQPEKSACRAADEGARRSAARAGYFIRDAAHGMGRTYIPRTPSCDGKATGFAARYARQQRIRRLSAKDDNIGYFWADAYRPRESAAEEESWPFPHLPAREAYRRTYSPAHAASC